MANKRTSIDILLHLVDRVSSPLRRIHDLTERDKRAVSDLREQFGKLSGAGKKLMVLATALMALMVLPATGAAQFEAGMVDVRKTTNLAFSDIQEGISGIVDKGIPTAIEGLNEIAATAGQLGIKGKENVFEFTEAVAMIEAVSDLSADRAGSAFARFSNVFDIPLSKISNMGSAVNELSNTTTASAGYIVDAMERIGKPIDSLTYQNLAGLAATISDVGLGAERGGTAFRNVFTRMQTNAKQMAKVMKVSTSQWASMMQEDGLGALTSMLYKLKEMEPLARAQMIKKLFGEEAFVPVQKMVDKVDLLNKNVALSNDAFAKNISLQEELKSVQGSTVGQWTVAKNQLKLLVFTLGAALLPAINLLLSMVTSTASAFRRFMIAHPILAKLISIVTGVTAGLLGMAGMALFVVGSFGQMVAFLLGGLGGLSQVFWALNNWTRLLAFGAGKVLAPALKILSGAFAMAGRAMMTLFANPIGLIILGIGFAILQIYLLAKHFDKVKAFLQKMPNWAIAGIGALLGPIGMLYSAVGMVIKYWDRVKGFVIRVSGELKAMWKTAGAGMVTAFVEGLSGAWSKAIETVKRLLTAIGEFLPHSDARVGPLSTLTKSGEMFSRTFAKGILSGADALSGAADHAMGKASPKKASIGRSFGGNRVGSINVTINGGGRNTQAEVERALNNVLRRYSYEVGQ